MNESKKGSHVRNRHIDRLSERSLIDIYREKTGRQLRRRESPFRHSDHPWRYIQSSVMETLVNEKLGQIPVTAAKLHNGIPRVKGFPPGGCKN